MTNDKLDERTLGRRPNNVSTDDATLDKHLPIREPQPGESDHSELGPERRDPEPPELPRKDC
jgi:hypothetical protein